MGGPMKAIELLDDGPRRSAYVRHYRYLTSLANNAWEGYYTALWAGTLDAAAEASEEVGPRVIKKALGIPSPFHFREYW